MASTNSCRLIIYSPIYDEFRLYQFGSKLVLMWGFSASSLFPRVVSDGSDDDIGENDRVETGLQHTINCVFRRFNDRFPFPVKGRVQ
jgi:hypothetical protein